MDLCLHARSGSVAPIELVIGTALQFDELTQTTRFEHPAEHVKEADEVGLARTVGSDQHRGAGQIVKLYVLK